MELSYHRLCLNKGAIIMSELEACVTLFEYLMDHADHSSIENEIAQLRIMLDLLSWKTSL
jgi:hypothetical protein